MLLLRWLLFPISMAADEFFGGVTSLAEQLDKVVLLVLRDGKHLIGRLTSYDNFGSLVLENSSERKFAGGKYCDVEQGVFLVRGENITLIGEVDKEIVPKFRAVAVGSAGVKMGDARHHAGTSVGRSSSAPAAGITMVATKCFAAEPGMTIGDGIWPGEAPGDPSEPSMASSGVAMGHWDETSSSSISSE